MEKFYVPSTSPFYHEHPRLSLSTESKPGVPSLGPFLHLAKDCLFSSIPNVFPTLPYPLVRRTWERREIFKEPAVFTLLFALSLNDF
jgi:hypothetical protein